MSSQWRKMLEVVAIITFILTCFGLFAQLCNNWAANSASAINPVTIGSLWLMHICFSILGILEGNNAGKFKWKTRIPAACLSSLIILQIWQARFTSAQALSILLAHAAFFGLIWYVAISARKNLEILRIICDRLFEITYTVGLACQVHRVIKQGNEGVSRFFWGSWFSLCITWSALLWVQGGQHNRRRSLVFGVGGLIIGVINIRLYFF